MAIPAGYEVPDTRSFYCDACVSILSSCSYARETVHSSTTVGFDGGQVVYETSSFLRRYVHCNPIKVITPKHAHGLRNMRYPILVVSTVVRAYQSCQAVRMPRRLFTLLLLPILTGQVVYETRSFYVDTCIANPSRWWLHLKFIWFAGYEVPDTRSFYFDACVTILSSCPGDCSPFYYCRF